MPAWFLTVPPERVRFAELEQTARAQAYAIRQGSACHRCGVGISTFYGEPCERCDEEIEEAW